jgi:hypothetical protein
MPFEAAFKSKVRLIDNSAKQQDNPKAPPQKLAMDLSLVAAERMSIWLQDKIKESQNNGSTIRVYHAQNDYEETPGFTMWGSMWEKSGSFSPGVVQNEEAL